MSRVEESLSAFNLHRLRKCLPIVVMFSLIFSVLFNVAQFANIQPVYGYGPGALHQSHPTNHEISAIETAVTDPTNAYDQDNGTYTRINYGRGPEGYYQLVTFEAPYDFVITQVDFKMRYSATQNTAGEQYKIDYHVGATAGTTTLQGLTGDAYTLNTRVWTNVVEPNDGTWNWTDVSDIKFRVSISAKAGSAMDTYVDVYEAWVTVQFTAPDQPTVSISPSNVTDYGSTPEATVTLRPDGDGTFHEWDGTPTGTYDDWNDITPDGDSSYLNTSLTFKRQSSTLQNASATETWDVGGIRVVMVAKGTTLTAVQLMLVIGGVPYYGDSFMMTGSYAVYSCQWAWNPATSDYWTWSDINATEAGVRSRGGETWRVTQLYVEVLGPRLAVDLNVDYVENLSGFQFELAFDPNVIQGISGVPIIEMVPFKPGPFLGSASIGVCEVNLIPGTGWNNTLGKLWITGANLVGIHADEPEYCPDGGGLLATIFFYIVGEGETGIHLGENTGLKDYAGDWIIKGQDYVGDGYFRNIASNLIPNPTFTSTPVDTPVSLEGYKTHFDGSGSTAAEGRTITTYKWYIWRTFREQVWEAEPSPFRPDGDGTYTGWTHPVRVGNYTEWDDEIQDQDDSYVRATAGGMYESSTLEDHTTQTWPIGAVRVTIFARVTSLASDEKVRLMLVIGGIKYEGEAYSLGTTHSSYSSKWEVNPATGVAWNWTSIDALEAGVGSEQVGGTWTGEIRVTQLYIEVIPTPLVTTTVDETWDTLTWNYTRRGEWNVTLTVIDDQGAVGTATSYVDIKAHDVFITDIKTNATKGRYPREVNFTDIDDIVEINVTLENQGDFIEDTTVSCFWSAYYEEDYHYGSINQSIETPTVVEDLPAGGKINLIFYWDTTGRNLTHAIFIIIHANASRVQYEYDVEWHTGKVAFNEFNAEDPFRVRFHDVTVTEIAANATAVWAGEIVEFQVTVVNQGDYNQTGITVKLYNQTDVIGSQTIPLMTNQSFALEAPGMYGNDTATLTFIWDTTDTPWANYTIKAEATWTGWATEDYEPHDNTLLEYFYVKIPGDVDGDGDVDGFDLTYMCGCYGATPGHPRWDEECDINLDGIIDGFDLTPACGNYGKHL